MSRSTNRRRQQTPWLHRRSRYVLGAIAAVGAVLTGYLTVSRALGTEAACPVGGCDIVLSSPYASVFGLPLTLFGFLAYTAMIVFALGPLAIKVDSNKELRAKLEEWSWLLLFMGSLAMAIFSGYLMYVLTTDIQAVCTYCIVSAASSLSLLVVTLLGRYWDDIGQLVFVGVLVAIVTLVGTGIIYADVNQPPASDIAVPGEVPPPITTTSGESEIALAKHLSDIGAKKYSAYWCPHCHEQQRLFGREAFEYIDYVECDPEGYNAKPQVCRDAGIEGFPTWEINGEKYSGTIPLDQLAELSGYTGPRDFKN